LAANEGVFVRNLTSELHKLLAEMLNSQQIYRSSASAGPWIKLESGSMRQPILVLITILLAVIGLSAASHWMTSNAANDLDLERSARAVEMSLKSQIDQVKAVAEDNANWDDAAIALYRDKADLDFGWRTWGAVSDNENVYETVFAIDTAGKVHMAYEAGLPSTAELGQIYGNGLQTLVKEIEAGSPSAGGFIVAKGQLRAVGMSKIVPTSDQLSGLTKDRLPVILVFSRIVSPKMLAGIGDGLVLSQLQLTKQPTASSILVRDPVGRAVAVVGWKPSKPGNEAFWKASPMVGLVAFLRLAALAIALTYCYRFYAQVRRSALVDSLSGLPNRRALELAVAKSLKRGEHLALAFVDLDGFKAINDNYGHSVGDQLITECSALAMELAANCKMVARLGGDEFAIFSTGSSADENLQNFVENLLHRLSQPFHLGERTILIGASIGIASLSEGVGDVTELMRRADIAMYASKQSGKMRCTYFDPEIDREQSRFRDIDQRMRQSLEDGHFEVQYQPLVDARTGQVVSLEALLRWNDPAAQNLTADIFIPIAEETGLIDRIGLFVLTKACTDAKDWLEVRLSVNISSAQLRNPDFPSHLKKILDETQFPAERLELEITETYVVLNPKIAVKILADIQMLGIKIALDDFGTGYASIGFLRQFQFDTLKIDQSLVSEAVSDEGARAMVQASIVVARALGMQIVAEGIENEEHAIFMRAAGCDHLQGWYFSRAVKSIDVLTMIQAIGSGDQFLKSFQRSKVRTAPRSA
jgi:diguanylate cyclase (GGDEF)-like protein